MKLINIFTVFFSIFTWTLPASTQTPLLDATAKAVECRVISGAKIRFIEALNLVCLIGEIDRDMAQNFLDLNLPKSFSIVVNSGGGYAESALDIAEKILFKNGHVIVDNVCWSACANYLFLSGKTKVVLPRSTVAWHGGPLHVAKPNIAPNRRKIFVELADRSDLFFINIGVIKDLIYFPPFDAKGEIPKVKDLWIATQEQLEEYYFVRGIEYMWDITKDPEFIAERAAGKTIHLKFKIP